MSSQPSRSLGNVKMGSARGIVFPPLTQALNHTHRGFFQEHSLMVHGDGVRGPTPMEELKGRRGSASPGRPTTSARVEQANAKAAEELREMQNKEKQYQKKIQTLQKAIEQLRLELKDKDDSLTQANLKLQQIEEHFRLLYEEEKSSHGQTRQELSEVRGALEEKEAFVQALKERHEQHTRELKEHHEAKLSELKSNHEAELADKDRRLENLKKQMASHLKDNSWERQQQLEELSKELGKMSEEAALLKMKLKVMSSKSQEGCENCASLRAQLDHKQLQVLEKDAHLKQLTALCKKFEGQLNQQDVIMKQFAQEKGFKTAYQPKK